MSYGFDMGFAQANSLQEAMAIALEYTQSQMTEKNIRKTIRDNLYYIPSVRTGYIADEESKNRRADTLADTADRYWLEALFTFRFLYKLANFPNFGRPAFLFANKRSKEL